MTKYIYKGTTEFNSAVFKDAFMHSNMKSAHAALISRGLTYDFDKYPHLLVAGVAGSGKTNLLHCIILSMMYNSTPAESQFVLIDPKQCGFSRYEDAPHLYCPVVYEPEEALRTLSGLEGEMRRRFSLMRSQRKDNWEGMHIFIVIDELASLVMQNKREFTRLLSLFSCMSRASGIHLICGTQYPQRTVLSASVLVNFDTKIVLRLDQGVSYRTVLGCKTPLEPTKKGEGLFYHLGEFYHFQTPYIDRDDFEFWRSRVFWERKRGGIFSLFQPRIS